MALVSSLSSFQYWYSFRSKRSEFLRFYHSCLHASSWQRINRWRNHQCPKHWLRSLLLHEVKNVPNAPVSATLVKEEWIWRALVFLFALREEDGLWAARSYLCIPSPSTKISYQPDSKICFVFKCCLQSYLSSNHLNASQVLEYTAQ